MRVVIVGNVEFGQLTDSYEYCVQLHKRGIDVSYLGTSPTPSSYRSSEGVFVTHVFRHGNRLRNVMGLTGAIDALRPDLVHVFHFRGCILLPVLAKQRNRKWLVDVRTLHVEDRNGFVTTPVAGAVKDKLTWIETEVYDAKCALTPQIATILGPTNRPVTIIPLGASATHFAPAESAELRQVTRRALGYSQDNPVVLYPGSVSPSRVPERMLDAFALLARTYPDVRFLIVGRSQHPEHLQRFSNLVQERGLHSNLQLLSSVPYQAIARYYCASDIGFSYVPCNTPFRFQPPTKVIEYMMSGLITVSNRTPSIQKILVDGQNGFLCGEEPSEIAAALSRAIQVLPTGGSIREAAKYSVERFDWSIIAGIHLHPLYRRILAQ